MGVIAPYACIEGLFFIRPGLYRQEQYLSVLMTIIFLSIFYMGQLFSWLYLLPWSLSFFMSFNQLIAEPLLDFDRVVDYMMMFQKVFIIVATWPIVLVGAMRYGFVTPQQLRNLRGMVYVGTFIAGMLLTPPDCFAQCCVALPLIAVYELIILVSFLFV
jgi:sec-independent protein translocase protein TatC